MEETTGFETEADGGGSETSTAQMNRFPRTETLLTLSVRRVDVPETRTGTTRHLTFLSNQTNDVLKKRGPHVSEVTEKLSGSSLNNRGKMSHQVIEQVLLVSIGADVDNS